MVFLTLLGRAIYKLRKFEMCAGPLKCCSPYTNCFLVICKTFNVSSFAIRASKETFISVYVKIADGWIRTRVLWYRKRPHCQMFHIHEPNVTFVCYLAV